MVEQLCIGGARPSLSGNSCGSIRAGNEIGKVGEPDSGRPFSPSLSRDEHQVALHRSVNGNVDIWLLDVSRGILNRFTDNQAADIYPQWSPDGDFIAFSSFRKGVFDLYRQSTTTGGGPDLLLSSGMNKNVTDWSRDGRFLLYMGSDLKNGTDIWALPLEGDQKPFPVAQTSFEERDGQFSPDSRWIAYRSNESGRFEIYVQPFPGPGHKERISTNGGAQVRWRRDGTELFDVALDGRLMAVPIRVAPDGRDLKPREPVALFATRIGPPIQGASECEYVVSSDGQRFLMNTLTSEAAPSIGVILNWRPETN
jgi:Tol biopolymer transport system component